MNSIGWIIIGLLVLLLIGFVLLLGWSIEESQAEKCSWGGHEWEWDERHPYTLSPPRHTDPQPWKCKHCPARARSNGAGGFGP